MAAAGTEKDLVNSLGDAFRTALETPGNRSRTWQQGTDPVFLPAQAPAAGGTAHALSRSTRGACADWRRTAAWRAMHRSPEPRPRGGAGEPHISALAQSRRRPLCAGCRHRTSTRWIANRYQTPLGTQLIEASGTLCDQGVTLKNNRLFNSIQSAA